MLTHELPPRDDRSDNFRHLAGMIVAVAKHYDISVDTTTEQRWNDCLGLLREFDTLVDDYRTSRLWRRCVILTPLRPTTQACAPRQ